MRKEMKSPTLILLVIVLTAGALTAGALTACSSLPLPGASSQTTTEDQVSDPAAARPGQPLETRLAIGTLALEGTDLAVTAGQATELLPLWKAVKSLSNSETASQDEITALYTQIEETMTAEQVQAIETKQLSQEETSAIMEKFGIEMPQNPLGNLSEDERATRVAQFQAQGGQRGEGGQEFPGGGGPQGQFSGGVPPQGGFPDGRMPGMQGQQGSGQVIIQGTPQPGQIRRGMRGGMNLIFVDPLIQLLQERAGS